VLVSGGLADAIAATAPDCLGEVVDARSGHPLKVRQLRAQATLPRFTGATSGVVRERPCPTCKRDGHFGIPHVPIELHYSIWPTADIHLFATYERFGNSRLRTPFSKCVFAAPLLVAGPRLLETLATRSPRGLEMQPLAVP
jgi:hypothetical protein